MNPKRYKSQNYGIIVLNGVGPNEGGGGGELGPNTVGTNEIINDSVQMEDLNKEVKETMLTGDNRVTQEELDKFKV